MSFIHSRNFLERKYTLPLLALFAVFFTSPVVELYSGLFPLPILFIILIVLWVLHAQRVRLPVIKMAGFCGCLAFSLEVYWRYTHHNILANMPAEMALAIFVPAIIFYGIAISAILKKVFTEKKVTGDTVWGGIFVYFLIAILWGRFYHLAAILDAGSFKPAFTPGDLFQIFYFSMVTLTTVGYGDISPATHTTMILAVLEAAAGQIYMAVFVARLIALEINHRTQKNSA